MPDNLDTKAMALAKSMYDVGKEQFGSELGGVYNDSWEQAKKSPEFPEMLKFAKALYLKLQTDNIIYKEVIRNYIAARDAYEEATKPPNSHAMPQILPHGSPIMASFRLARISLSKLLDSHD